MQINRRAFAALAAGTVATTADAVRAADGKPGDGAKPTDTPQAAATSNAGPTEAPFERDYAPPDFKPSWRRPQLNRILVQDFVIFAHSDFEMTKKLLEREPGLIAATVNWGGFDWESGLNGAAHMGRRDIVEYLLANGGRIDIFCAAMLGMVDVVRAMLTLEPKLIDAKGPHGFSLHFHAQVGAKAAEPVLDYLQSVKKLELRPVPFLSKPKDGAPAAKPK